MTTTPDLGSLLVASGAVTLARMAEAQRRRALYGGSLDTVLLELAVTDEETIAAHLETATGLPALSRDRRAVASPDGAPAMTGAEARRLSAVPIACDERRLDLALHPECDRQAVVAWAERWAAAHGKEVALFVTPELRFRELRAGVYGEAMSPRLCALLGKLAGPARARSAAGRRQPAGPLPPPPVDTGPRVRPRPPPPQAPKPPPEPEPEPEILIDEDSAPSPAPAPRPARSDDRRAIPGLIDRLGAGDKTAAADAHAKLIALTRLDFGKTKKRWQQWWQKARNLHRAEWLLEALAHKRGDLRLAASQELQELTGVYFGYHFDLPERDREAARRRWRDWWDTVGKAQIAGPRR